MSDKEEPGCGMATALTVWAGVAVVATTFMRAWIMADCWTWFIMPLPFDFPSLSYLQCLGVQLFVSAAFRSVRLTHKEDAIAKKLGCETTWQQALGLSIGMLVIGWPAVWFGYWVLHKLIS